MQKNHNNDNISFASKIYTGGLILAPIINQYAFPGLTFIELFALFGMLLLLVNKEKLIEKMKYVDYAIICFILTIVSTSILIFMVQSFDIGLIYLLRMTKYIVVVLGSKWVILSPVVNTFPLM
jgi:hypothetical protein